LLSSCSDSETDGKYKVGIVQLVEHPALDAATDGFKQALIDELGKDGVSFDYQNAQNDANTCATIVNQFVSNNVDLIMANATPALQAAAAATGDIPILGTSVTEYGVALEIKDFNGTVGGNISGTSDLAPLDKQANMITEWCPDAKKVGLLYCSKEANSQYQVDVIKADLENKGLTVTLYPFTDSNDLAQICTSAADNSDVIYVPTDNTVAENTGIIDNICEPKKVPVIAGESGICSGCGIATLSISYYDLGYTTGQMAVKILRDGADISTMAIEYAPTTPKYNADKCTALGITPLDGYEAIAAAE
jgi:putative ABC transport system substrate-binding protein